MQRGKLGGVGYSGLLDEGAAKLPAIRVTLLARVEALKPVSGAPDLHLLVDGHIVRAHTIDSRTHRFTVPAGNATVTLASRSVLRRETEATLPDRRRLGAPVERLMLSGGGLRLAVTPDCPALSGGFHADDGSHRWTSGHGTLPPQMLCFAGEKAQVRARCGGRFRREAAIRARLWAGSTTPLSPSAPAAA